MRERLIAGTDVRLTELAFGGASLGNLYSETCDEDAAAAVAEAWNCGIRYFDTAPHYGLGLSERRLGEALAVYPRDEVIVSTKVGRLLVPHENPTDIDSEHFIVPGTLRRQWDFTRDGVMRSVEASLDRLGMSYVDILYLHDPDVSGIGNAAREGAAALIELRDQGVARAVGIGSNDASAVAGLLREADVDTAMLAGRFTLLEQRAADEVFEAAAGRSIVAVGVFNSGLLSKPRPGSDARYDYAPTPIEMLDRAHALADVAERNGVSLPHAALSFPLLNDQVASIAIGMRSAAQVRANVELYEKEIPATLWSDLRATGLLA